MKIKIGANPLCWINTDFPHLGANNTVEQCLSDISFIGYEGVELEDPFKNFFSRLPAMLASRHLSCIGKWHSTLILENGIDTEMRRLDRHIDTLETFQSGVVIVSECSRAVHRQKEISLSQRPTVVDEKEWVRLCDGLEKMALRIQERGFVSAYHHHMGTVIQTKEDIDKLMRQTGTLGLLLDTGHLAFAIENPLNVLREHLSRVTHVHCKSVRPSVLRRKLEEDSSFFSAVVDGVFTVPGDKEEFSGEEAIDFAQVIEMLIAAEYSGWIVMEAEQDPGKADPFAYAQLGYETLHSLLTQGEFQAVRF